MSSILSRLNNVYPQLLNDIYSYLPEQNLATSQRVCRFFKLTLTQYAQLKPVDNVCLIQNRQITSQDLQLFWNNPKSTTNSKQARVAILTVDGSEFEKYKGDDKAIIAAFKYYGVWAEHVVWSNPQANWQHYDAAIVRSTWNYSRGDNFSKFIRVLTRIEQMGVPLFNCLDTIKWNSNKKYLQELEEKGIASIPTVWITHDKLDNIESIMRQKGWVEAVIKPSVSAGGANTFRFTTQRKAVANVKDLPSTIRACKASGIEEWMLQPFLPAILDEGEFSAVMLEGQPVKVIQKKVSKERNEFRVQDLHGGTVHRVENAPMGLLAEVQEIFARMHRDVLFGRIDVVRGLNGRWQVMELEYIEPFAFFDHSKKLALAFAWATIVRLHRREALYSCNIKVSDHAFVQKALMPFNNSVHAIADVFVHGPAQLAIGTQNLRHKAIVGAKLFPHTFQPFETTVAFSNKNEMHQAIAVMSDSIASLYANLLTAEGQSMRNPNFFSHSIANPLFSRMHFPSRQARENFKRLLRDYLAECLNTNKTVALSTSSIPESILQDLLQRCGIQSLHRNAFPFFPTRSLLTVGQNALGNHFYLKLQATAIVKNEVDSFEDELRTANLINFFPSEIVSYRKTLPYGNAAEQMQVVENVAQHVAHLYASFLINNKEIAERTPSLEQAQTFEKLLKQYIERKLHNGDDFNHQVYLSVDIGPELALKDLLIQSGIHPANYPLEKIFSGKTSTFLTHYYDRHEVVVQMTSDFILPTNESSDDSFERWTRRYSSLNRAQVLEQARKTLLA